MNSPNIGIIVFIGITILSIFGWRGLVLCIIGYGIYRFIFPKIQSMKHGGIASVLQNWKSSSKVEDAIFKDPQNKFFNSSSMNFFSPKRVVIVLLALVFLLLFLDGFVMVPAGQVAVILDRGRGVLETPMQTGLHVKIPFWQTATKMDTRLQTYTMSISSHGDAQMVKNVEGVEGGNAIEALTKDGQKVNVDVTVQFYLEPKNAALIYKTVGLDYVDKIVRPAARSTVRNAITGFNSKELFQIESRQKAQDLMVKEMKENLERKKIALDDVLLRNIQFSDTYLQAIEEKQVAEQKIQKAEFEKQEAAIQKDKTIIQAQAEAESIRLKGESLRANPSVIQFEMVQKIAPGIKWGVLPDGVLPMLDMKSLQQ